MKRDRLLFFALILICLAVAGCTQMPAAPMNSGDVVIGHKLYNIDRLSYWKYNVTMATKDTNASWDMMVNNSIEDGTRHMGVYTLGNGMDITYDVRSNVSSYKIDRMYANGTIGDYYQNREVSPLQIFTLPDTGLSYYYVPFRDMGNVTIKGTGGNEAQANVYSASDNRGFTVTYWVHPEIPAPVRIEMSTSDFEIVMMLTDYKTQ